MAIFSKKHYEFLATELRTASQRVELSSYEAHAHLKALTSRLADALERDNTSFDRKRFVSAVFHDVN